MGTAFTGCLRAWINDLRNRDVISWRLVQLMQHFPRVDRSRSRIGIEQVAGAIEREHPAQPGCSSDSSWPSGW